MAQKQQYVIKFGRTDGSAIKTIFYLSRTKALELSNSLAYVFFQKHPFKNSEVREGARHEGNGFYVEYKEEPIDA